MSPEDRAQLEKAMKQLRDCCESDVPFSLLADALENLKPLGEKASPAVAGLLYELALSRNAGVRYVLEVAAALPATPELVAEVRRVAKIKAVYQGRPNYAERRISGNDVSIWQTATGVLIRKKARETLAKLDTK
jgi:hypothetical protein